MMTDLFTYSIKDWNSTLIIGMGNRIKQDDGVGIYITEKLIDYGLNNVIIAENSIENYIGKINSYTADQLLMVDAVDQNENPGYFQLLPLEKIENTTSNTHNLSLDTIANFLTVKNIWILAIQPGSVSFGFGLSEKVLEAADSLSEQLIRSITNTKILSQL